MSKEAKFFIVFVLLWIVATISIVILYCNNKAEAKFYYNQNFLPPRIHQLCSDNFIGTDWDKAMKYEKRCRGLWTEWTNEIKSASPY